MAPVPNPRVLFNLIPEGLIEPNRTIIYDDSHTIDLDSISLEGGIVTRALAFSLDPYMRNRMINPDQEGDMHPFLVGQPITGFGVAEVIRSDLEDIPVGSHVYGFMAYQHYSVISNLKQLAGSLEQLGLRVITNEYKLPWQYFVGGCGMTGQTAYYGLKRLSDPKAGETIFVSSGAGAVGQIVVQLSKRLGLKVIASVGSEEKVQYVKALGADHVFNYKTSDTNTELKKHGPINIYFDNVGGSTLEAAIYNAAQKARFIICGAISSYNQPFEEGYGVKNLWLVSRYRIRMEALIVIDWEQEYGEEFYKVMPQMISSGEIKYKEHVYNGLRQVGQGLQDLFTGRTFGKAVVVIDNVE